MREKSKKENVNYDYCDLEIKNVEMENSVAKLLLENMRLCKEINHVKEVFKEQLDSIKKTRVCTKEQSDSLIDKMNLKSAKNEDLKAQIQDKVFVITSLKNDLRKRKGKEIVDIDTQKPSANNIVLGMFKLDLDPLAPKLLQNREAHIDYLKYTKKQADTLWGIVKQAKAKQPLDNTLDFALPPKKTTSHSVETQKLKLKVYSRKPKNVKNVGSSKKAKIVESKNANHSKPNHTWGSSATDIPSSSSLVMTGCPDCSLVSGLRMFKTYDRELLSAHELSSKTKSWLWRRRLSYLNFGTLNKLAKDGLARSIPRLKFQKDHLCSACALGQSKKFSHQPKSEDTNKEKPRLSRSRSHLGSFLCFQDRDLRLNATVRNVRTYNGTEFINETLHEFYENGGISHQTSVACTPLQNGAVERRNRTLVEAARTMLIFSKALLFLWAEAINTACYTQNCSLILIRYNKTPYELMQDKKLDLSFFHVFGALCYPTNDNDDIGKLDAKADIGIFVGYALVKKAFRVYNKRTHKIIETIHVTFDELTTMASEQFSSGSGLHSMTHATFSSGFVPNPVSQQSCIPPNRDDWDHLFQPMFDEYFNPPSIAVSPVQVAAASRAVILTDSPVSTSIGQDAP
nr:hypothetical protein [Tanacetum cinerariifolium]